VAYTPSEVTSNKGLPSNFEIISKPSESILVLVLLSELVIVNPFLSKTP
jgi:hypothetical protein